MQLVSVAVPTSDTGRRRRSPAVVAADGAVGQRGRAVELNRPPPLPLAELPLTVQLVSVSRAAVVVQAAAVAGRTCRR